MRALSLHPAATELAFALGAGDMLVGRTDACDHPQGALKIPSVGGIAEVSGVVVDIFEPSLILTGPGQQELSRELGEGRATLACDPSSLEELFAAVAAMGEALGKQVEADMLAHDLRRAVQHAQERTRRFKPTRVYCEISHSPPAAASGYIAQLIAACGAQVFEGEATPERLAAFDPQAIISCVSGEDEFDFALLSARDGWQHLNAVRYERLFCVPGALLHHPGPRLADGLRLVAKLLHGVDLSRQQ